MKRAAQLEVFGRKGRFFVRLRYSNGRKALVSESYPTWAHAIRAARAMRDSIRKGSNVDGESGLRIVNRVSGKTLERIDTYRSPK